MPCEVQDGYKRFSGTSDASLSRRVSVLSCEFIFTFHTTKLSAARTTMYEIIR